jgi:small subunit ribosomal protein S20
LFERPRYLGYPAFPVARVHAPVPPGAILRLRLAPTLRAGRTDLKRGTRVANIKSQIKRNKQNEKARQRNKAVKSALRTSVRQFREAADTGDTDRAAQAMRSAYVKLDKAASKGVIHKNQAANRKSKIAKRSWQMRRSG